MISPHVGIQTSRSLDLLQLPLWSRRPPQVVESTHDPQHGRQSNFTRLPTEAGVRACSVMNVTIYGPVDPNGIRLGKNFGFTVRTDEVAEYFVALLDLDRAASVVNSHGYIGSAIGTEGSVEPDAFHRVVQELVVCFGALNFGPPVDTGKMYFAFVGEVVVKYLGELNMVNQGSWIHKLEGMAYHLGLIRDHSTDRWYDLRPCDLAHAHPTFQQPSYHVYTVVGKRAMVLMHAVNDASDPARRIDHLDIRFHKIAQLLRDGFGSQTQGKRLRGIVIVEDAGVDDSKHHVHLLVRVNAVRMVFRLQGEREDIRCEMDMRKVAHAANVSFGQARSDMATHSRVMST